MSHDIQSLRVEVATSTRAAYGAMRAYAEALCSTLPAGWYGVEARDTGADADKVHAEKKALYAELKKVQHSNPSTIWARVRNYGAEFVEGAKGEGEGEGADGEGEGEGGSGAREARSLRVRLIEELITLRKACKREGNALEGDLRTAHTFVCSALAELKVDISKV